MIITCKAWLLFNIFHQIPTNTDILLTHGPPAGIGDLTRRGDNAGCVNLLHEIQTRVKPLYHGFGHIHEGKIIDTGLHYVHSSIFPCHYVGNKYIFKG